MKRLTFAFAFMLCLAVMSCPAMAKSLKIGSSSPLTGEYNADGNDIKNGAQTAIDVITAGGGVPGFDKIEFFPQDDACDPKQGVAAANKAINLGVTAVIGAYCSSTTIPASETLAEENIFMITPASTNEKVTERGLKYMFRTCGRDDDQSKAAAKFLKDSLKAKTMYIVDDKTTYSQGLADNVEKEAKAKGINVLGHEHINPGDKDFSAVLTKVKAANPDVFYISLQNSSTGSLMVIQTKRMQIKSALLAQDAVYHPQLMEIAKQDAEGMYLTFGYTDKESSAYKKFLAAYSKYGKPGAYSAYAYDSAMAYLLAVKAAKTTDPAKVKAEMLKLNFQGASKQIKYKENGDSGSDYIVFQVQKGAFKPYWNPETGKKF